MATETKVINVAPESELGRFSEEIGEAPVILEKDGIALCACAGRRP